MTLALRIFINFSLASLFLINIALAQNPTKKNEATAWDFPKPKPVNILLAYGSELRPERDVDGNFQDQAMTNFAVGYGFDQYVFILEAAQLKESSGNATLNVERTLQDYMLWGQYRALAWNHLVPFLGLGLGVYQETVVTKLSGASTTDQGPNKFLDGVSFGVGTEFPMIYFTLEARILFGDELDRNPTLGGLARVGLHF